MARGKRFGRDLSASFLVFLVALPLCLGIAIASGAPPARGIVTGIIGGILAGTLAGSPLSVSGPAAGLTTLVFELIAQHGLAALGPIVLLAGAFQVIAGFARIGGYVRSMPPAIVEGMLAAIGMILVASQLHVIVGTQAAPGFIANIAHLPAALHDGNFEALCLGLLTIAIVLVWERVKLGRFSDIPGPLVGVVATTLLAAVLSLHVARVPLPESLGDAVALMQPNQLLELASPALIASALSLALIASIESLLSAAAIDRMTPRRKRSDYSRELMAQGAGNMACGLVGALPMTGVIVRSAANVRAGARTRLSAVFHGVWLLALVVAAPWLLRLIPTASLAGLLLLVGVRLVEVRHVRALIRDGKGPIAIYSTTVVVILCSTLLYGVLAGLALYGVLRAIPQQGARGGLKGGRPGALPLDPAGDKSPDPI
jgi:MFS superfamily sulfate permease-like transporter